MNRRDFAKALPVLASAGCAALKTADASDVTWDSLGDGEVIDFVWVGWQSRSWPPQRQIRWNGNEWVFEVVDK